MPWLTDLDDALRVGGIGHWASPGWERRGHGAMSTPRGILIHHTAGGGPNDWKVVQNGRPGLSGPLAQLVFNRDGGVSIIAAGQAWHAGRGSHPNVPGGSNANLIGIEGVSRGVGNDWTAAQRREYPRVAAALCRHYRLPSSRVLGHKEFATPRGRKIDPGDWDMGQFRADVQRHLGGAPPDPPPLPPPPPPSGRPVLREGDTGPAVVSLQRFLNRVFPSYSRIDLRPARFGPQTAGVVREFQRRSGLLDDAIVGPATWTALERNGYR